MRVLLLTVMQAMVVTSVAPHQSALVQGKAMDEASLSRMSAHFERTLARQDPFDDDDGDEFEHGDAMANSRHVDPSDYSVHQFLAADDARGISGSDEENGNADGDDGAAAEVARNQAEAKNDDFGSEDTPERSFIAVHSQTAPTKGTNVLRPHKKAALAKVAEEFNNGAVEMNKASLAKVAEEFNNGAVE